MTLAGHEFFYVLGGEDGRTPVPQTANDKLIRAFMIDMSKRVVAKWFHPAGEDDALVEVSTVFIGHSISMDGRNTFETMVMVDEERLPFFPLADMQYRTDTWDEAARMHDEIVALCREELAHAGSATATRTGTDEDPGERASDPQ